MNRSRSVLAASATAVLAVGLSLGAATTAQAAPAQVAVSHAAASAHPISVTFNLLVPNAPVTFTVNGAVVGTGTTSATGVVNFVYTPSGLAPGYYRLVATTSYGISSSIGFGVN